MDHVTILPGEAFRNVLRELSTITDAPPNIKSYSSNDHHRSLITDDVKWCHCQIIERGISARISRLMERSEIVLPKYEAPERNPELEARIVKLKAQQANREYREMTKNVDQSTIGQTKVSFDGVGNEMKEVNRQIVAGMQYLLSVVGTFFAIFIASGLAVSEFGFRILLSVFCAIAVGVAEIYFVIREDMCQEEYIEKKRQ